MEQLKPCPFCGKPGIIETDLSWNVPKYLALCSDYDSGRCYGMQENWFDDMSEAIEAWNTRADDEILSTKKVHEIY